MTLKTPLYEQHVLAHALIVDFAGWQMPLHYGSQLQEHQKVRQDGGVFDVSHMTVIDLQGPETQVFLRYLLANDVKKLIHPGQALYSCMLNEKGGVKDDLIVYFRGDSHYRLVVNAGTRAKDWAWINEQAQRFNTTLKLREELSILAIQGPQSRAKFASILSPHQQMQVSDLKAFEFIEQGTWFIARTGYTGEEGVEVILPATEAVNLWQVLLKAGVSPCGLGARDTLRLEAGFNLYGSDMDETTTPLESNLAWTVAFEPKDRDFIGRAALEAQKQQGIPRRLVGLVLQDPGVLRAHQKVILSDGEMGEIMSGGFAPTLNRSIALARVPASIGSTCQVEIRGKLLQANVVKPPFVKHGKAVI